MPVEEQLATIFEVLEGGVETTAEVIPFPVDAGATALEGTTTTVQLGNGIATEVSQLTVTEAGATTTAGVGLLAMDVGAVGLAIAPALGILAGVGLYSLAPEFWTNVSNALVEAGQTVGGKVRGFINSNTKEVGFSAETIEIFKQAFMEAGLFNVENSIDIDTTPVTITSVVYQTPSANISRNIYTNVIKNPSISIPLKSYFQKATTGEIILVNDLIFKTTINGIEKSFTTYGFCYKEYDESTTSYLMVGSRLPDFDTEILPDESILINGDWYSPANDFSPNYGSYAVYFYLDNNIYKAFVWWQWDLGNMSTSLYNIANGIYTLTNGQTNLTQVKNDHVNYIAELLKHLVSGNADNLQPDATYPTVDPFPQTYPTWNPWNVPVEGFPDVYPIEIPEINPNPDQSEAQNPSTLPDDNPDLLPWFIGVLPQPVPNPNPYPEPSIEPDPDPQPEPDPIEEPTEPDTDPNPVDPNPDPSLPALPIVPDIPDTVPANAMFTVYKPTIAQVNAFGGWLWSNNIMEAIKRIWQNPLDGIISFMKVYVDAPTSGSDTIKVGMLDSEVSSAVVTGQFVTVECGSINIREKFYNATDYSPFVSLHVYLPFIGIVELDIDEFMNGEIKITYHVDVYTGTCLAEIKARRSYDKPEWTIIYTFSGNASQQLPLTSASFSGALSSLVSIVGGGLAIASGGGLGLLAGATGLAHAVTHEMVHLAHSGSLSANAGIMGARKPFLILTRRRSYDANGYNELYGYPSNKTVFLNNCSGFVKVKDIQLKTSATDVENKEIETLLKNGVII